MVFLQTAVDESRSQLHPTHADFTSTTVYGSQFAGADIPRYALPENEMPAQIAYKLIKDELALDGNPVLNLASYVSTYMEPEAVQLMSENMSKNFIDFEEYPQTSEIHTRCINIMARLFNAPTAGSESAVGTSCVGSSEGLMLSTLALKRKWQLKREAQGKSTANPNMIMSSAVQVCVEKACRYFEVEARFVNCEGRYTLNAQKAIELIDENTIGIVCILGNTYTGHYDNVKELDSLLSQHKKQTGIEVSIHVDAASGGFVAPFVQPELEWDFRLPSVVSINTSGHKYGLTYAGIGWCIWRDSSHLPSDLIFNINYLGADQASFTLNFSKSASNVIGQYYVLIRNGRSGFEAIMNNLIKITAHLAQCLAESGCFEILSSVDGGALPLVAFRISKNAVKSWDEFDLSAKLREHGWIVPAYTMAPSMSHMKLLRIVVREDLSYGRCELLIKDILHSISRLDAQQTKSTEKLTKKVLTQWKATGHLKKNESGSTHDIGSSVC